MDRKKDFQAVIAAIRADTGKDYPKAMMNSKQEMNDTATVNFGGSWGSPSSTGRMAENIMADERFQEFLERQEATAEVEKIGAAYPFYQIRITFKRRTNHE